MEKIEAKTGRGRSDEKAKEAENVRGSSGDYADHLETSIGLQVLSCITPALAKQRFFDPKEVVENQVSKRMA